MIEKKVPVTRAVAYLRDCGINFQVHFYTYKKESVTESAAREVGVDQHVVIKTLVMESGERDPLIVLMHGDRKVSTKAIARQIGVKKVRPSNPNDAEKLTGYQVGGISPFATRKRLPVYVEETILDLPQIVINGGRRGLLIMITPQDLSDLLNPIPVNVAR